MILFIVVGGVFLAIMYSLFRSLFLPKSMRPGFDRGAAAIGRFFGRVFFLGVLALIGAIIYFGFVAPKP